MPNQSSSDSKPTKHIITEKATNVKTIIYNVLGGLGIWDLVCFGSALLVTVTIFIFLIKITIIGAILVFFFLLAMSIFLVAPIGGNQQKLYTWIGRAFYFLLVNKKQNQNEIRALFQVKAVTAEGIMFETGHLQAKLFVLQPCDLSMLTPTQRQAPIRTWATIVRQLNLSFDLTPIRFDRDLQAQFLFLQTLVNRANDRQSEQQAKVMCKHLHNFFSAYQQLEQKPHQEVKWIMIVYGTNLTELTTHLGNVLVNSTAVTFEPLSKTSTWKVLAAIYQLPASAFSRDSQFETFRLIADQVHERKTCLQIDEDRFVAIRKLRRFPRLVDDSWLYALANLPYCRVHIKTASLPTTQAVMALDKAIIRAQSYNTKKASSEINAQLYLDNFRTLLYLIRNHNEVMKMTDIFFVLSANSRAALQDASNSLQSEITKYGFGYDSCYFQQLSLWSSLLGDANHDLRKHGQEICSSTFGAMWPFMPSAPQEPRGLLLGFDPFQNPVFFDIKYRSAGRVNSNCIVLGMTGYGKTYNVCKQINWLILQQTRVFIIDPEQEYHGFAATYGGIILKVGKDDQARLNPLEVFGHNLMEHITFLEQFFRIIYPGLTDFDFAWWQKVLLATYKQFNITTTTNLATLRSDQYPIFSDFYAVCCQFKAQHEHFSPNLELVLWKLACGGDGYLWNHHSTLQDHHDQIIIIDTHELTSHENLRNAQLFLLLSFLDRQIKINKQGHHSKPGSWVAVVIDEAHLLISDHNTLALNFIFQMTKRIRKYNGILYIISQNVNDFIGNPQVKTQTQGIINNCSTMFIHHLAPHDLHDLKQLLASSHQLNEYERNHITMAGQGDCLFINGTHRGMVRISNFYNEDQAWHQKPSS